MGAATCNDDAADGRSTDQAGLPGAHIDVVAELEKAAFARGIDVIGDGGAAEADGFTQHLLHGGMQAIEFLCGQAGGHTAGADFGAEEALIGVDVANTVQEGLIEQGRLDGGAAAVEELAEVGFGDLQGLCAGTAKAEAFRGFILRCLDGMNPHATEAARIDEAELLESGPLPGAQHEHAVGVRRSGHIGIGDDEAAGHAEVHDPLNGIALRFGHEVEDDVLAHTADALDGPAGERFGHGSGRRLHRLAFAREPHFVDAVAMNAGVHTIGYSFDFGEFGHGSFYFPRTANMAEPSAREAWVIREMR